MKSSEQRRRHESARERTPRLSPARAAAKSARVSRLHAGERTRAAAAAPARRGRPRARRMSAMALVAEHRIAPVRPVRDVVARRVEIAPVQILGVAHDVVRPPGSGVSVELERAGSARRGRVAGSGAAAARAQIRSCRPASSRAARGRAERSERMRTRARLLRREPLPPPRACARARRRHRVRARPGSVVACTEKVAERSVHRRAAAR